ncbi:MAG: hypothetical protein ACE5GQ_02360 [Nitrospinales bacterium]
MAIQPNRPSMWKTYLLIGISGFIVTGMVSYSLHKGIQMSARYAPWIDAVMEIKLETTLAHLWFEEIISGDANEDMQTVWEKLDKANTYANLMLAGGKNLEGIFVPPLEDEDMRRIIRNVQGKMAEFIDITRQRIEGIKTSEAGSDIDERYDVVFVKLLFKADEVESKLQNLIAQDLRTSRHTQVILIVVCLLITLFVGIVFYRFEHARLKSFDANLGSNGRLESHVAQRAGREPSPI